MMERIKIFVYKFYKPLVILAIILCLNYADGFLIDLLLPLFQDLLPELAALILTLLITVMLSLLTAIPVYIGAVKCRRKIFPNQQDVSHSKTLKINTAASAVRTDVQPLNVCHCTKGYSTDFSGMMKYDLNGERFTVSVGVTKHANGYGLIRIDAGVTGHFKTCAFRINYCPRCGGRLSDLNSADDQLLQKNNL